MKKIFLPIIVLLILALTACGGNVDTGALVESAQNVAEDVADSVNDELNQTDEEMTEEPTPEPTKEPTPEPTEEPTATPEPTAIPVSGVTGQVVDIGSSEPLVGGQVCVQGTDQCASVDESGMYSLAELDPAEYVFEVTATDYVTAIQTISLAAGESLTQDFALTAMNPVLAVLPDEVILRGAVVGIGTADNLLDEATIAVGDTFLFENSSFTIDFPDYNLSAGEPTLLADVRDLGGNGYTQLVVAVPNRSTTEIGRQADAAIENIRLSIKTVGETNQPIKANDVMEVVLTDPNSSNLPFTVNFYRGEARELVATFTINNQ